MTRSAQAPDAASLTAAGHARDTAVHAGLLFLRVAGGALLLYVHGLPKVLHYSQELARIEDPFHLGAAPTLLLAILSETVCPLLIALGVLTRLACLPIVFLLLVALLVVHREWSIADGQFGWLLLTLFVTVLIAGPGRFSLSPKS
ncbi:DoxX family protein [Ralstonia syzygii subsp. celebesensis]|uniref:LysR family transcriptional regulator n=2 Tax=Ralstonia syzygii subsp. celebesensis TaxID=1310168 RepID=A0A1U9VHY3_9RALS|nr:MULTISPECIES: DoxX family protein [Ralstonia solanacearum species complex]AQW29923.1 LysR family transcriptional regulator [blood disease bacterium A2-HR MARDI]QQV56235.1 DoxX family protein [Ralstonia syzygii subsp. celebesensis]CBJ52523.1 putative inner membrane protein (yphA) [Ralstonia solanacearum PSI07]CCA80381.1 putative inner membrane protein (yphA) [blood disease bacterium R229]